MVTVLRGNLSLRFHICIADDHVLQSLHSDKQVRAKVWFEWHSSISTVALYLVT